MKKITFFLTIILLLFSIRTFAQTSQELYDEGKKLYDKGDYAKAIEVLEKSIKIDPNFAPAYNTLGLAYKETNPNLAEVAWYFKTALDINPKYLEAFVNLGKAYYGLTQFDKAEESFKNALTINPDYGDAQFSLAWVYLLGKSQPNDAIFYFKKVLEKTKIPYAYFGLGLAYFMTGERALVLDMITALRTANQDKLAEQLENMVRDYYYIPTETGGSLINIKPPTAGIPEVPKVPAEAQEENRSTQSGGFTTRVHMRGKFFNVGEEEGKKASTVQNRTSTIKSGSAIVPSSPPPVTKKETESKPNPIFQEDNPTIEIRGPLAPTATPQDYQGKSAP